MPSPFPGMDPYLEHVKHWKGVHASLTDQIRTELNCTIGPRYVARNQRYTWTPANHRRKEVTHCLEVFDTHEARCITAIEVLDPTHKQPGFHREAYLMRRSKQLASGVNVIEIDLLRVGNRLLPEELTKEKLDYVVSLRRPLAAPTVEVTPWVLRHPLPVISVPLHSSSKVHLALKTCLDRVYDTGDYRTSINYSQAPEPPLRPGDEVWVNELLAPLRRTRDN